MHAPPLQAEIRAILADIVAQSGTAIQVAAYHRGRLVCDQWDGPPGSGIDGDRLMPVFSVGKGVLATAALILVERGELDLDHPVAERWPGTPARWSGVTLRRLLDHTAGLAMLPEHGIVEDLANWDGMCRWLADQEPAHPPGARRCYHAITMSWLIGALLVEVTGKPCAQALPAILGDPQLADCCRCALDGSTLARRLPAEPGIAQGRPLPADHPDRIARFATPPWVYPLESTANHPAILAAAVPAMNLNVTARAMARLYAGLVGDGIDGRRLLSRAMVDEARRAQAVPGETRARRGLGWMLFGPDEDPGAVFGHDGYGGSIAWADARHDLAIAVTRQRGGPAADADRLIAAVRAGLGCV